MGTISEKLNRLKQTKNEIKQSIINKGVNVGDVFSEYSSAIDSIQTGIIPNGTATPEYVLSGKTFYGDGIVKQTGTMWNVGKEVGYINSIAHPTYTIAKGYHDGTGTISLNNSQIEECKPENILKGKNILGVIGTLEKGITPIGTLEITENGEKDVTNYAKVIINVPQNKPTLNAPTITLNGNILTITNPTSNGNFVDSYNIYSNGILLINTTSNTLDLSTLLTDSGTYVITIVAIGNNFNNSVSSNSVEYIISSGYSVEIGAQDVYDMKIYDGNSTSGILLGNDIGTYVITSGYVCINVISSYSYFNAIRYEISGGVSYLSKNETSRTFIFSVSGNGYINIISPCLIEDTPITLANNKYKMIQDITYEDDLLVWDFDKGDFTSAKPIWIQKQCKAIEYNHLVFSDGSELNTINQHRIFNVEKGMFTYPMSDDTPIGTTTFNDKGEYITLVSKEVIKEEVNYYNIITDYYINLFASNILTSCRLSNIYPIKDMKYVKDNRDIIEYEDFNNIPIEYYYGLRLGEQPTDINKDGAVSFGDTSVEDYVKRLIDNKKE